MAHHDISIRHAVISDIAELVSLAHDLNAFHRFDMTPDHDKLTKDWPHIEAYVACNTCSKILGFVQGFETYQLHNTMRGYEIQNLYVAEHARSSGIGHALLKHIITQKYALGIASFKLTVLKNNALAERFYKSMGFQFKDGNSLYFVKLEGDNLTKFLQD